MAVNQVSVLLALWCLAGACSAESTCGEVKAAYKSSGCCNQARTQAAGCPTGCVSVALESYVGHTYTLLSPDGTLTLQHFLSHNKTSWFFSMSSSGAVTFVDGVFFKNGNVLLDTTSCVTYAQLVALKESSAPGVFVAGALEYEFDQVDTVVIQNAAGETVFATKLSGALQSVSGSAISHLSMGNMVVVPGEGYRNYPAMYYFGWHKWAWDMTAVFGKFGTTPEVQALVDTWFNDNPNTTWTGAYQDFYVAAAGYPKEWQVLPYTRSYLVPGAAVSFDRRDNYVTYTKTTVRC